MSRNTFEFKPSCGGMVADVLRDAIEEARRRDEIALFAVNGVKLRAYPESSHIDLCALYDAYSLIRQLEAGRLAL